LIDFVNYKKLVLHVRCLKDLLNVLEKYMDKSKTEEFIKEILKVRGTNSSFKIVFRETMEYIERKLNKEGGQTDLT